MAERHIDKASCQFYGVPLADYPALLAGSDWTTPEGKVIPNNRLTRPHAPARSYAVCTDTIYLPNLHEYLGGVHTLYHEATFLKEKRARAKETYHSTAEEAAMVAKAAGVERLVIGHYSARYNSTEPFLREAQEIFPNTLAADEGMTITL